jgi:hypothetical protein
LENDDEKRCGRADETNYVSWPITTVAEQIETGRVLKIGH